MLFLFSSFFIYRSLLLCSISRFPFDDYCHPAAIIIVDVSTQKEQIQRQHQHENLFVLGVQAKMLGECGYTTTYCLLLWYFKVMRSVLFYLPKKKKKEKIQCQHTQIKSRSLKPTTFLSKSKSITFFNKKNSIYIVFIPNAIWNGVRHW